MRIPFTKAHGAGNDFLLTWLNEAPREKQAEAAVAICERHTGIGADGWLLVAHPTPGETEFDGAIQLFNSDGSIAEISGNGTRCAAAFLVDVGLAAGTVRIRTGAGVKSLRLLERRGMSFVFEMNMGRPRFPEGDRTTLHLSSGPIEATRSVLCKCRILILTGAAGGLKSSGTHAFRIEPMCRSSGPSMSIRSRCASSSGAPAKR